MKRTERILVELLAPPFLAMIWIAVTTFSLSDGVVIFPTFLFMVVVGYLFSIIPSLIYTSVMEVWFRSGLRARFGLSCTAAFSSLLGTGAGFLACAIGTWLGPLISFDCRNFALIGGTCGLVVGFYVAYSDKIG
jgi:hypothetical protein